MTTKIVIHVRGGCVTSVMSTHSEVEVELFDVDNLKGEAEEKDEEIDLDALWAEKTKDMKEVW